jgi:hypothetical protein
MLDSCSEVHAPDMKCFIAFSIVTFRQHFTFGDTAGTFLRAVVLVWCCVIAWRQMQDTTILAANVSYAMNGIAYSVVLKFIHNIKCLFYVVIMWIHENNMKFNVINCSRDKNLTVYLKIEFKQFRLYGETVEWLQPKPSQKHSWR